MKTVIFALMLAFSGCAQLGLSKPSIDQQILTADQAVTIILTATDNALLAKIITPAQAQSVSTIAHQVDPLLDAAKAANAAGNASSASSTLTLVNALIAGLQAYVPPPQGK
jgi:hypothetical protein